MYINIAGTTGEGKTTQLLKLCAIYLKEDRKVVFISDQEDCVDYSSTIKTMVDIDPSKNFRPVYAKDLATAIELAPIVDKKPYGIIALDGYDALTAQQYNDLMKLTEDKGIIISTSKMNSLK